MYVCLCKGITEKQLIDELNRSHNNDQEVLRKLGVGESCGICLIDALAQIKKDRDFKPQTSCPNQKDIF